MLIGGLGTRFNKKTPVNRELQGTYIEQRDMQTGLLAISHVVYFVLELEKSLTLFNYTSRCMRCTGVRKKS